MKQLTDSELKDYAVSLLDKQGLEQYEQFILDREVELEQDCEANGFHNTPTECEDFECAHCPLYYDETGRKQIGCPYVNGETI